MGTTYTRQSSFSDGDTITAALFNNEYNQLLTAFSYASSGTTGHQHDGTAAEGGNVHTIGDQDFLNKIVADSTNNRWGVFVEVSSSAVEQIRISDGVISPVTDNDIDLGTSSLEFKDAYFDGTVTTDGLTVSSTTNLDGAIQVDNTITVGVDDTGYDVKFFGDTASAYMLWDTSTDDLVLAGAAGIDLAGDIDVDGTANLDAVDIDGTVQIDGTVTVGVDDTGKDVKFFGATSGSYLLWDESADSLLLTDSTPVKIGDAQDMTLYHDGSNSYLTNAVGALKVATETSGIVVTIGHTTSETTVADNLTVTGNASIGGDLDVTGSFDMSDANITNIGSIALDTITNDGTDITLDSSGDIILDADGADIFFKDAGTTFGSATNTSGNLIIKSGTTTALTFSGANVTSAGTYTGGGTMTTGGNIVIPDAGNIGAASDTDAIAISSGGVVTMNQIPVFSAGINVSGGTIAGTLATAAQGNITSLGTLTALTVDDVAVDGKVITMTGSASDTAVFTAGTNGTLSIVTTDAAAAAANIQITADGTVDIDSAGVLTLDSGAAINIEPASGSAILLDGTISIDAGVVTGATSITSTAFVGDLTGDVTGNTSGTAATVTTAAQSNITSLGTLTTLTVDSIIINGTNIGHTSDTDAIAIASNGIVTFSQIPVLPDNTIDSDHYVDGSIDLAHMSAESIDSDQYVDGSIDTAHIGDDQVTLAKIADLSRGSIIYGNASGVLAELPKGSANTFLKSDGTDLSFAAASVVADDLGTGDAAVSLATTSGNITIDAQANDADVIIKVDDAGASVTAVTFDGSDEGNAIFVNDIQLKSDGALLEFGTDLDTTLTHTDGTGLTLNSTNKLTFGDAASFVQQSSDGVLKIDGEATIDMNASTAVTVSNDLKLDSDASVLGFGTNNDVTITHNHDKGITLNSKDISGVKSINGTDSGSGVNYGQIGGRRNMVYNGDMAIAQRGTTVACGAGANAYGPDRWQGSGNCAGAFNMIQQAETPDGFANSLQIDVSTPDTDLAVGDYVILQQKFEGFDLQGLNKGDAQARPVTLSFWVRSSETGVHIAELQDRDNSRWCSQSYTIAVADTWEYQTLTYPADTTGALDNNSDASMDITFWLLAGDTYSGGGSLGTTWHTTANTRAVGQVNVFDSDSNNLYITGVQLELGDTATAFEYETPPENLIRCNRYYYVLTNVTCYLYALVDSSGGTAYARVTFTHPPMRTNTPTGAISNTLTNAAAQGFQYAQQKTTTVYGNPSSAGTLVLMSSCNITLEDEI